MLTAIAVIVVVAVVGYPSIRGMADERLKDCEQAFEDWVNAPEGTPQP